MHVGVLPDFEFGEVETEGLRVPDEVLQLAVRGSAGTAAATMRA